MKIFRIDKTRIELFRWLDPWGCLDHADIPGYFAVGATLEEDGNDFPAGLMCCFESKNRIVIEWICTDPGHRHERIGEGLLLKAYEIAAYLGKAQVGVLIDHSAEKEGFIEDAKSYFTERLFEEEEKLSGISGLKLSDIKKLPWYTGTDTVETLPLDSIDPQAFRAFITTPETELDGEEMCKFKISELDMKTPDKDLSRVILDGDDISGFFAAVAADDCIIPVALYSESEQETDALLRSSVREAAMSYDPDTAVVLVSDDKKEGELFDRICGEKTHPVDLLLANVSDYLELLKN
jgi:hypothetical protein